MVAAPQGPWRSAQVPIVHKTTCPACAFVGPTRDVKGIARAQGLTPAHWRELVDSLGQEEALGSWCLEEDQGKAGNCLDPEEESARQQLEVWLEAWKRNPERPTREWLELLPSAADTAPQAEPTFWTDAGDSLVGGRSAQSRNPEDRKLVTPVSRSCWVKNENDSLRQLWPPCRKSPHSAGSDRSRSCPQQARRLHSKIIWSWLQTTGFLHVGHRHSAFPAR